MNMMLSYTYLIPFEKNYELVVSKFMNNWYQSVDLPYILMSREKMYNLMLFFLTFMFSTIQISELLSWTLYYIIFGSLFVNIYIHLPNVLKFLKLVIINRRLF